MRLHTVRHGRDIYVSRDDLIAALSETPPTAVHPDVLRFLDALKHQLTLLGSDRPNVPSGLVLPGQM